MSVDLPDPGAPEIPTRIAFPVVARSSASSPSASAR